MLGMVEKIQNKKWRSYKNYGFISGYDGEHYFFVLDGHEDLKVGDEVSFEGRLNEKGYYARHVKKKN